MALDLLYRSSNYANEPNSVRQASKSSQKPPSALVFPTTGTYPGFPETNQATLGRIKNLKGRYLIKGHPPTKI